MAFLSRLFTFTPGAYVIASEANAELDNIINALKGSSNAEIKVSSAHATAAAIVSNQTGASSIIHEFANAGTVVAKVEKLANGTIFPSTDEGLITKGALLARKSMTLMSAFFGGIPREGDRSQRFIATSGNFRVTGVRGVCEDKSGGGTSGSINFRIYRQLQDGTTPVDTIGNLTMDNSGNAIVAGKTYPASMTVNPTVLADGDSVYIEVQNEEDPANGGSAKMRKFTVELVGYTILES